MCGTGLTQKCWTAIRCSAAVVLMKSVFDTSATLANVFLNPSAASLVFTTDATDPKPLTDAIAKRPWLDTLFLRSLLDLQPVFVGPRCESHGDVWPLKTRVAREKIGQEEGMEVAYVWC